ncbi:MAG: helix-turn-helix domain-containing protein [Proteobacteria bacterium]|nr:helix-turn-helix domain-containing protein [Pseudomonadota bacterium]
MPIMTANNENPMELLMRIGLRLRKVRIEKELTQAELADRAGISRKVIGRMERGDGSVTLEKWVKVAMVLEVAGTWEHLFEVEEDPFVQYDRQQKEQTDLWKKRVRSKK